VKLGAVAAAVLVALVVVSLDRGTNIAWSMEQTIEAIEQIKTIQIEGMVVWSPGTVVPFCFWVQAPTENSPLKMRGELANHVMIAKGDKVYECWPDTKTATVHYGPGITDLKYWYKAAELVPWMVREGPKLIQQYAEKWQQSVDRDPNTGEERILATCTYPPSSMSFLLIVDPETKLIEGARLWSNLKHEGDPYINAQKFTYNEEFAAEMFEVPPDTTIIDEKDVVQAETLFEQAEQLFHKDKKYAEAIELYQQAYDKYPHVGVGSSSLMMIGCCHSHLGNKEKAIEFCQKAYREFPIGWEGVIQFYLGGGYMDNGQTKEALAAFEACLADAEGKRSPDQFPVKNAREAIVKLKGEQR